MIYLLSNGKQQIIAYGNPNLREYSILARFVERLDICHFDYAERKAQTFLLNKDIHVG